MHIKDIYEQNRQKTLNNKLKLLIALSLIGAVIYTFWGVNSSNFGYFLPKRALKVLAIIIVSFCVGYSSVIFQTITNNKILTPSIMGLDSLYLFLQTLIIFAFGASVIAMMNDIWHFLATVGVMIGFSFVLYYLLFEGENRGVYFLVLVGMVLGAFFDSLASFMQILLDPNEFLVLQGSMFASFNNINEDLVFISLGLAIFCLLLLLKDTKKLDILSLGKTSATNLGIDYKKLVRKSLIIVSVLVSASTVLVGPIIFLGILLVSLSREFLGTYKHSYMQVGAFLIGCVGLFFGLFVVERLLNYETTVSVILNFVGGIYFIYLILKEAKNAKA